MYLPLPLLGLPNLNYLTDSAKLLLNSSTKFIASTVVPYFVAIAYLADCSSPSANPVLFY